MIAQRFNPEKDFAPMPFDDRICLGALEMKKSGLAWRPHVGCFVWDPDLTIKPDSPFPGRIYFILSLRRFIEIFGTVDRIAEKLKNWCGCLPGIRRSWSTGNWPEPGRQRISNGQMVIGFQPPKNFFTFMD
jgi:hypothetical protein